MSRLDQETAGYRPEADFCRFLANCVEVNAIARSVQRSIEGMSMAAITADDEEYLRVVSEAHTACVGALHEALRSCRPMLRLHKLERPTEAVLELMTKRDGRGDA